MSRIEYHVTPVGDLIEHEEDEDNCPCGPETVFVEGGAVFVHASLDGRELTEALEDQ
jgi:hypothetical protein